MARIAYIRKRFQNESLLRIARANEIVEEYALQGFDLTLRQLYYQFVARGWLANSQAEYNKLGKNLSDARLSGRVDWEAIVDRTRHIRENNHWNSPEDLIRACARQFKYDKWADQLVRCEVWIEKDALIGVLDTVCPRLDVAYFSCRGYVSQSAMWRAGQRCIEHATAGQSTIIFHLGDHDPSGLDMTRDIRERLTLYCEVESSLAVPEIRRIALNMDQVRAHNPPPNPAKMSDARASDYVAEYGDESWELDALDPATLSRLVTDAVMAERDDELWEIAVEREAEARRQIGRIADRWEELTEEEGDGE